MLDLVQYGSDPLVILVHFGFISLFSRLVMSSYVIQGKFSLSNDLPNPLKIWCFSKAGVYHLHVHIYL